MWKGATDFEETVNFLEECMIRAATQGLWDLPQCDLAIAACVSLGRSVTHSKLINLIITYQK